MPDCTAPTNEANVVTSGYLKLGDLDVLIALCGYLSSSLSTTAKAAMSGATSSGYQNMGDVDLDQAILSALSF